MAGKPFRPSNFLEGEYFIAQNCRHCRCDRLERGGCDLLLGAMAGSDLAEWKYDNIGIPMCSAFEADGDPEPTPRCTETPDMFA
ncbi:hypothetical protein [uncultured Hyphomicrobium sp.]|uniref:hypothetical protein n=1 Tax=uncultured Hyphomicrobium sp. TaxID=194373 RepID=UPI0025DC9C32|nr:hypothetical protein [uncultured Hyphomicrobium sp.]